MTRLLRRVALTLGLVLAVSGLTAPAQAATLTVAQYEAQVAAYVNDARRAAGLNPLVVSTSISSVARAWSGKMAAADSLTHNPSYGVQMPAGWSTVAENVAFGSNSTQYPASSIHQMFMESAPHRANILRSGITHLGVGVAFVSRNGQNQAWITQNFGAYPVTAAVDRVTPSVPFAQIEMSKDLTTDGAGEVLAVDRAGNLVLYPSTDRGKLGAPRLVGGGWGSLELHAPGDWNGDRLADVVATDRSGDLFLFAGRGNGSFSGSSKIGYGWSTFRIIPAGDVNNDRAADLLAIDSAGRLWVYPGNGSGGFGRRVQVGNGWNGFQLHAAGDMNRDGKVDILGIDSRGYLWYYSGRGGGYFNTRVKAGNGWGGYTFGSGADLNGDGLTDLVGRASDGRLYFYAATGPGRFAVRTQIGSGW